MNRLSLNTWIAARCADLALANIFRAYPVSPGHVLTEESDAHLPRVLHPAFHGSFDWHSCVHMHWLLVRLRRRFPSLGSCPAIDALLDTNFTQEAIAGECAYLARPSTRSFERTYGWAWLLKLAEELSLCTDDRAHTWSANIAPLAQVLVARYLDYLPKARYPIRYGVHPNSAFGLAFALDYARRAGEHALEKLCIAKTREWFGMDRDAPAAWEPSGADFLSPTLMETELMRRVCAQTEFTNWLTHFLPGFARREPASLFAPAAVSDRTDPQIVHLDGLNLTRAWCLRGIAGALPSSDPRAEIANDAAATHLAAGLAGLESGDYAGSHWLASFAVLALDG